MTIRKFFQYLKLHTQAQTMIIESSGFKNIRYFIFSIIENDNVDILTEKDYLIA